MRWFTRGYAQEELEDADWEQRRSDYERHLERSGRSSGTARELLPEISLQDAQLLEFATGPNQELTLKLVCGDLQRGYERLTLRYRQAELVGANAEAIRQWLADGERVADEIDRTGVGYEHRILVWPAGEFGVRFTAVAIELGAADASARRAAGS
jgi:hypothetical protein